MKTILVATLTLMSLASLSWGQEKKGFDCVSEDQGVTLEWRYSTLGKSQVDVKIIMDGDSFDFNQDEIALDLEEVESFLFTMKNSKDQNAQFNILELSQDRETPSKAELTVGDGKKTLVQTAQMTCSQAK
ncbi:MAG: hypothetical protein ACK5Y2_12705 [Bdellovibrionales bacterium]